MKNYEKNILVRKYEPLVNKITRQYTSKLNISWDIVKSMAYEGLALAINNFDSTRSKMTFLQYAGFSIRNNILSSLDNELRTVKLSNYAQKKAVDAGESLFNSISIDQPISEDSDVLPYEININMYEEPDSGQDEVFEYLYECINYNFSKRDQLIFYKSFGLNGYINMKGKEIAKELNISESLVSIKLKQIIKYIKNNKELVNLLSL